MNTDYTITADKQRFDLAAIHAFLSRSYWSPGVPMSVVEKALANSVAFGLFLGAEQFAFKELANPSRMMERWDPDAYSSSAP
jgi:hypothetical protein